MDPYIFIDTIFSCCSNASPNRESIIFGKVSESIKNRNNAKISYNHYDDIFRYISKGGKRWINLYPELKKEPFLGVTFFQEGLNIAMAYALSEKPLEVMKFIDENNI